MPLAAASSGVNELERLRIHVDKVGEDGEEVERVGGVGFYTESS